MINKVHKYLRRNIFSFISIEKTIEITKISKKFINELEIKAQINMVNFCKLYYQNDNIKPSLYILIRQFKEKLPKNHVIQIYTYFMNNYIKNNSNEIIELNLLLDDDLVGTIINKNLLKTNKISLIITSLQFLFTKNIDFNFKDNKNIEQIYFEIIDEDLPPFNIYNKLNYLDNINYLIFYLLVLKYFNKFIPKNIKKIGFSSISLNKIDKIINIFKEFNQIKKNEEIKYDNILNVLFDELCQYKNIKKFEFGTNNDNINSYLQIFNKEYSFINNLDELKIRIYMDSQNNDEITLFNELIKNNYLKDKLIIYLTININQIEKMKSYLDLLKFSRIEIYGTKNYKKGEKNIILPNQISNLYFSDKLKDFNIMQNMNNLKDLSLDSISKDVFYNILKYLANLEDLWVCTLSLKDFSNLNDIFEIFNNYNKNLKSIEICTVFFENILEKGEIPLNTHLDLKNLTKFIFRFSEFQIFDSYEYYFKINTINIDKCEKLEEIRVPYYFECNSINVLNNLKKISIDLLETDNIKFLDLILNCKNLNHLFISFLLPFKNYNILNYLYGNIKHVRKLECELHFNVNEEKTEDQNIKIKEKLKICEEEYINQIDSIFKSEKNKNNYFEELYILPRDDDYENFRKLKYDEKIKFLENFPIIEKYGNIFLEKQFLYNKYDFKNEERLLKKYFGIDYNYEN